MIDEIKRKHQKKISYDCFSQTPSIIAVKNSKMTQTDASSTRKKSKEVFTQTQIKKLIRSSITTFELESTTEMKDENQLPDIDLTPYSSKLQNKNFTYKSNQNINQFFNEGNSYCLLLVCYSNK